MMLIVVVGTYFDGGGAFAFGDRIAIVEIFGPIYDSENVVRQIKKYGDDGSVAAILLHVNSPGGAVAPTQEIYDEILRVRMEEEKPVIASFSSMAASGGYYLSCATDRIIANPGTLIGSIGVIIQYPIFEGLMDKIGVGHETIKTGDLKDTGSPYRQPTDEDREMLKHAIDDTYGQFVEVVIEGRNLTREEVLKIADGSIFTGRQGLDLGLVDQMGSFEEAIRITAELAGLEGEPHTIVEKPKTGLTIFDLLSGAVSDVIAPDRLNMGPELKYLYR